jgi:hypothetical protein
MVTAPPALCMCFTGPFAASTGFVMGRGSCASLRKALTTCQNSDHLSVAGSDFVSKCEISNQMPEVSAVDAGTPASLPLSKNWAGLLTAMPALPASSAVEECRRDVLLAPAAWQATLSPVWGRPG